MNKKIAQEVWQKIQAAENIVIIQAENPDIDSLGSALALEDLLYQASKKTSLYCPVSLPKYIRYVEGWDRVSDEFDYQADLAIIVDTASQVLLSKTLEKDAINHWLQNHPSITIDHHDDTPPSLPFDSLLVIEKAAASAEIIYNLAKELELEITPTCATYLMAAISGDTLGMSTPTVTAELFRIMAELTDCGANISKIEDSRRELSKKPQEILDYKADLIKRIEYHDEGRIATILIPFEDIQEYSDLYNPSVLVLDEMRSVENVEVAIAFKTYPDGKVTGKIRTNKPVANLIAGYFGGGGHAFAAGFRAYDDYATILTETIKQTSEVLDNEAL